MLDGEVTITCGGAAVSGWQRVHIHRSCEQVPNTFEVRLVSLETGGVDTLIVAGAPCTIAIDGELVLTGYVDTVENDADKSSHQLTISGRGKCCDLVDCTAEWPTSIINGGSVASVASKLAEPYGITVTPAPNDPPLPFFGVTLVETPFALIEETARYAQLLVYEDAAGVLTFAPVGQTSATGGLVWAQNVEKARVRRSAAERYSEYVCYINGTTDQLGDLAAGANIKAIDFDAGVLRYRRLGMTLEAPTGTPQQDFANKRTQWERARRAGRSQQAFVTVAGWRDAGGSLWAPNTLVPIYLPKHGITGESWVVGDVVYLRGGENDEGTRTELMLMPPSAFQPQPELLVDPNVDLQGSGAAPGSRFVDTSSAAPGAIDQAATLPSNLDSSVPDVSLDG